MLPTLHTIPQHFSLQNRTFSNPKSKHTYTYGSKKKKKPLEETSYPTAALKLASFDELIRRCAHGARELEMNKWQALRGSERCTRGSIRVFVPRAKDGMFYARRGRERFSLWGGYREAEGDEDVMLIIAGCAFAVSSVRFFCRGDGDFAEAFWVGYMEFFRTWKVRKDSVRVYEHENV